MPFIIKYINIRLLRVKSMLNRSDNKVNIFNMIVELIGGLGLFLYGMKIMGDGLENAAGEKLKVILEKVTSNRFLGVLIGALVTAVIQSSSATTVMVVSFVNTGLMNLMQAVGVIMGANIGTTITAQMVSLDLSKIAPLFIGLGVVIVMTAKKKRVKEIGYIALGFGMLFLGMNMMSQSMAPLSESNTFKDIITVIGDNRLVGVACGLAMTAIVQSSSATTGILVALASTNSISINAALPIILGCNIGTCVTALLASIGSNRTAKKAAMLHLMFNIIGVIIFLPFTTILGNFVTSVNPSNVARQVANAHTIFNIIVTIILFPLARFMVMFVNKILPGDGELEKEGAIYLDKKLLDTPVVAVGQIHKETVRMASLAKDNVKSAMDGFLNNDKSLIDKVFENEKLINTLEKQITDYLVMISSKELSEEDNKVVTSTFHVINDIERIGDHAENIAELALEKINENISIDGEAKVELIDMFNKTFDAVTLSMKCYDSRNVHEAEKIREIEENIDIYEKSLRESNIIRLNKKVCSANSSTIFLDLISNFERIGDHSTNIAESVE